MNKVWNSRPTVTGALALLIALVCATCVWGGQENSVLSAVRDSDAARLTELLAAGGSPEARDPNYMNATALMLAAERDDISCARLLLDGGADPDAVDQAGDTALNWAAYYGYAGTVNLLLEAGADPALTGHGNALEIALRRGHEDILLPLAKGLGSLQPVPALDGSVVDAVHSGLETRVSAALTAGGSPNAKDHFGRPALQLAAERGFATTAILLVEAGAGVNEVDSIGFIPLMGAAREGKRDIALALLNVGADPRHQAFPNGLKLTPLHLAAIGGDIVVVDALLAAGAQIDAQGVAGNTPAIWALGEGQIEMVVALLARGSNPNLKNNDGDSVRSMAHTWSIAPVLDELGEGAGDHQ